MSEPTLTPADGKSGVLNPGMGVVATAFVSGVLATREGCAEPIGSLSQMAHIRLEKRTYIHPENGTHLGTEYHDEI